MIINKILSAIKAKRLILLGEVHGTKEIPELFSSLFYDYAKNNDFNVCMEIPSNDQVFIDQFLSTGDENFLKQISLFCNSELKDGRNSLEYFNVIRTVRSLNVDFNRNINIFCIDIEDMDPIDPQNKREEQLASNILKVLSAKNTFVILGNVHASKKGFIYGKNNIRTAGLLLTQKLKSQLLSINFLPSSGHFFNRHLQKVDSYDEQLSKNFDITFDVGRVSACSFLPKNTNL